MAVTVLGLYEASKTNGTSPSGERVYKVQSTAQITTDIDAIIDHTDLPAYNAVWDATNLLLRVQNKRATAVDTGEAFNWIVRVSYGVPTTPTTQDELDPRDRDWLWNKSTEKNEVFTINSLFDTAGYAYPQTDATNMVNLGAGKAITNTAGEPPENGAMRPISRAVYSLTKYVNDASDIVTGATTWADVDAYIDTINDATETLLGIGYNKWELRMDDITYEPYAENGFECIKVTLMITADTYFKHIYAFPSAGYQQIDSSGNLSDILTDKSKIRVSSPQLLDVDGKAIPTPASSPYIKTPVIVSAGVYNQADWSSLTIPAAIP